VTATTRDWRAHRTRDHSAAASFAAQRRLVQGQSLVRR
jgi:hypothetical protein